MRYVLDTDVVVAAMRSPTGASADIIFAALLGAVKLIVSNPLMIEYAAICHRLEHRQAAAMSTEEVDVFLNVLALVAEKQEIHFLWRPMLRDANDEMVLEAAVNGKADAIVTFNTKDYIGAETFDITVIPPAIALGRLRS